MNTQTDQTAEKPAPDDDSVFLWEHIYDVPDPSLSMRVVRVRFYDTQYDFETNINGTRKEIADYYAQGPLNMSKYGDSEEVIIFPRYLEFPPTADQDVDYTVGVDMMFYRTPEGKPKMLDELPPHGAQTMAFHPETLGVMMPCTVIAHGLNRTEVRVEFDTSVKGGSKRFTIPVNHIKGFTHLPKAKEKQPLPVRPEEPADHSGGAVFARPCVGINQNQIQALYSVLVDGALCHERMRLTDSQRMDLFDVGCGTIRILWRVGEGDTYKSFLDMEVDSYGRNRYMVRSIALFEQARTKEERTPFDS